MDISKCSVWFRCKGCGALAGYFPDGLPGHFPPGSIAHTKPIELVRRSYDAPSQIQCPVYQQLDAIEYWNLHKDEPKVEPPSKFTNIPVE